MKPGIRFICLALLFIGGCGGGGGGITPNYTSKEGKFSIYLPGTPKEESFDLPAPIGAKMYFASVELPNREGRFTVACTHYTGHDKKINIEESLDKARDGAVANVDGKVRLEKAITIDSYPGREIDIDLFEGTAKLRIYIADRRLYQILAVGPKLPSDTDKVFGSFKLNK